MASVVERLAVLDGYVYCDGWNHPDESRHPLSSYPIDIPDYLNDWNALKSLEAKAREKLGAHGWIEHLDYHAGSGMGAVATPEQVAEAILAVLED